MSSPGSRNAVGPTSPTRESRSGSTPARVAFPGDANGSSTTMTRCEWPEFGRAIRPPKRLRLSIGAGFISMGDMARTRASRARSRGPTRSAPVGTGRSIRCRMPSKPASPRTRCLSTTNALWDAINEVMVRCRGAGAVSVAFTTPDCRRSSLTNSAAIVRCWNCLGWSAQRTGRKFSPASSS